MYTRLGNLFILSAPSGAGKSSLIRALLSQYHLDEAPIQVSVSHTTRAPRPGEVDGEHYHFVDESEFKALIDQGVFFEWAEVFGKYYGTSRVAIEEAMDKGIDVFLDIDWQGARQVKQQIPDAEGIFILPPSVQTLQQRLSDRGQDEQSVIDARMEKAVAEMSHCNEFDYVLINDDFDQTLQSLWSIVNATRHKTHNQQLRHKTLINKLLGE